MFRPLPKTIHGYSFIKVIGKGGFSTVYLVKSVRLQTDFVAKVIPLSSELNQNDIISIDSEVNALKNLNHPRIIRLYDHFTMGKYYFIILEYCRGGCLSSEIVASNPVTFERWQYYASQIADALAFVHSKNIAHRDIKPGNVLIDECGKIRLADFGFSVITSVGASTEEYSGSRDYEAPEIVNKQPHDPLKADVWALGVLFACLANGRSPWAGCESLGSYKKCVNAAKYHLRSHVRPEIAEVISKMLVVDPNERITMSELVSLPLFAEKPMCSETDSFYGNSSLIQLARPIKSADILISRRASYFTNNFARNDDMPKAIHRHSEARLGNNKPVLLRPRIHQQNLPSIMTLTCPNT